jgi:predicted metalloendopeptidase
MSSRHSVLALSLLLIFTLSGCGGSKDSSSENLSSSANSEATSSTPAVSSSTPAAEGATLLAAKTIAANAIRDGVSSVTAAGLLTGAGYNGNEALSKTRAFNLLYQAYHADMPAMVGQRKYGANVLATAYSDVPSEAATAVTFLSDHGLLSKEVDSAGSEVSAFNGEEDFTASLSLYLDRFHAYFGTSLKDDFANSVNHDYLYANSAYLNKNSTDVFGDTHVASQGAINSWIDTHITSMAEGTNKANIQTFKTSFEDETLKSSGDCAGAFSSYESLANAADYASLFSGCASLFKSSGNDPLFSGMSVDGNLPLGGKNLGLITVPFETKYTAENFKVGSALYQEFLADKTAVFTSVGFQSGLAENYAAAFAGFTADFATAYEPYRNKADPKSFIPDGDVYGKTAVFDIKKHLTEAGFSFTSLDASVVSPTSSGMSISRFLADHVYAFQVYFETMSDANFGGVKALAIYNQIEAFLPCNPLSVVTHFNNYDGKKYDANYLTDTYFRPVYYNPAVASGLITDYKETLSYRNNLALISKAILDLRYALKNRIAKESWLSEAGKKAAIAKVEKVKTSILASNDNATSIALPLPTYGTSLYSNLCAVKRAHWDLVASHDDSTFYGDRDIGDPFEANAFYSNPTNGICILFGYLASHDDFSAMTQEKLFSDLYLACGHELTHGFDTNGVNYDEDGKSNATWWSAEDHTAYTTRVQSVINFYQGDEVLPGQATNGSVVVSEACADVAGMVLTLDLATKIPDFDYSAFFKDAAYLFMSTTSSSYYIEHYAGDSHPYGRTRCNKLVSSVDKFYETFAIAEGDGMFTPKDSRPNVW